MKIDDSLFEKYRELYKKDPQSQVFAPLAEAYRERGLLNDAYRLLSSGLKIHPRLVSGFFIMGKVLKDLARLDEAEEALKKAIELAPENIMAHHTLAEVYMASRKPQQALRSYKMVLFINPNSKAAQSAVQKLESFSAEEFEEDVFSMTRLPQLQLTPQQKKSAPPLLTEEAAATASIPSEKAVIRLLSIVDAFIVRGDVDKAWTLLNDATQEYGPHPELARRMGSLRAQYDFEDQPPDIDSEKHKSEQARQMNLRKLEMMLSKIQRRRPQPSL